MFPLRFLILTVIWLSLSLPALCSAAGYHVYDRKGDARLKDGKALRESSWQTGSLTLPDGQKRVGKIRAKTVDLKLYQG